MASACSSVDIEGILRLEFHGMKIPGLGCCCGVIVGIVLTVFICCAAAFGLYCWFNPNARNKAVVVVENKWDKVKDEGDNLIDKAKTIAPPPEPILPEVKK